MPFNWFKRQFGGKKDEESKQESPAKEELKSTTDEAQPDSAEDSSAESTTTADTTPANAEDYLQWAKVAYQNIQKQQDEDSDASDTSDTTNAAEATEAEPVQSDDDSAEAEQEVSSDSESSGSADDAAVASADEPVTQPDEPEAIATEVAETAEMLDAVEDNSALLETDDDTQSEEDGQVAETTDIESSADSSALAEEPSESTVAQEDSTSEEASVEPELPTEDALESSVPSTDEPDVAESEAVLSVNDLAVEPRETVTEVSDSTTETIISDEVVEPETSQADTTVTDDDVPETDAVEAEADTTETEAEEKNEEAIATAMPFWAKAEAERQERLEKLKETAIEEPEEPEIELDEDFVWSAGVLASQGRKADEVSLEEITWLTKLRQGLGKTRRGLINELKAVVGQGPLNADAVMEIESLLLQADVGIDATDYVIEALQARMKESALPPEEAIAYLKEILRGILDKPFETEYSEEFVPEKDCLNIWLLTGVNGAGKTTTIGKLAHMTRTSDYNCLIAAADTFRAAAVEQVKVWGERSGVEVIANPGKNTDPAAVVFDAISAAQARDVELLLVDTAGRLQNKKNLMAELSKIRRIVDKKAASAKVESLLVLDATLGQNGLRQAQVFSEAAKLSGVVLTKLDGSAKGGVALAVVQQLGLPIRFIGAGEGIEDLRPFSSYEFVEALLSG